MRATLFLAMIVTACGASKAPNVSHLPLPSEVTLLTSAAWAIAVDADHLYWAEHGGDTAHVTSTVKSIPLAGGDPITLATVSDAVFDLAPHDGAVFWTMRAVGAVEKAPAVGGDIVTLATMVDALSLTANDTGVFWSEGDSLQGLLDSGGNVNIATAAPDILTADATNLYWVSHDGILAAPIAGGSIVTIAAPPPVLPGDIKVDATAVYWTDAAKPGALYSAPVGGGVVTTLATGQPGISRIAMDDANLYWVSEPDMTMVSLPKGGGASVTLTARLEGIVGPVAVAGKTLYYGGNGAIWSIALP